MSPARGSSSRRCRAGLTTLVTEKTATFQVRSSWYGRAGFVGLLEKALTLDPTRRLRFDVHAAGCLFGWCSTDVLLLLLGKQLHQRCPGCVILERSGFAFHSSHISRALRELVTIIEGSGSWVAGWLIQGHTVSSVVCGCRRLCEVRRPRPTPLAGDVFEVRLLLLLLLHWRLLRQADILFCRRLC